jgi:hypothetical protein
MIAAPVIDPLVILSGDRETLHLFALEVPHDEIEAFMAQHAGGAWPLREALGVDQFDAAQAEHVEINDLTGLGLSAYLIAGHGVDEEALTADRDKIDALEGHVVILHGKGFDAANTEMSPRPPLRHIGAWRLTPAPTTAVPLRTPSAMGQLPLTDAPQIPTRARSRLFPWISLALIAATLALILWLSQ